MKQGLIFILLIFQVFFVFSQELPPIEKFTTEEYGGENQNWMISQAPNKYIYIANNGGLLEFNGAKWKMYPSPNKTIIRSVNVVNDRIYVGYNMEFGYWIKNDTGNLIYHSLVDKLKVDMIADENIWNIKTYNEWVLFQSQDRIYFYNSEENNFKIINSENFITKVFIVNNTIYYHVVNEGIYKINQGKPKLVSSNPILKKNRIINIFDLNNNLLVQTFKSGFFVLKDNNIQKWNTSANSIIRTMSVFNSIQLEDKSFVLGTIFNGIIHLSPEGVIKYQINKKNGLGNNTALSLFEDIDKNLWVGLDNGINCINIKSPFKIFNDEEGSIGTIYTSIIFNNYLYLGSNQGLFCKNLEITDDSFHFIEGTEGQVWKLFNFYDKELFCGHHLGTFIVKDDKATLIDDIPGTWNFNAISHDRSILMQGKYSGLYLLHKENDIWKKKNKIEGFDNSARDFEINNNNQVWISHGYKGVFKLSLDKKLTEATNISLENKLLIGENSSLIKYKNQILYAYKEGIFKYDTINKFFVYDSILSPLIEVDKYLSGKLIVSKNGKLWAFSKENINYLTTDNLTNSPKINQISIPSYLRKGMIGYENISLIKSNKYLLGTANGYITIDLSKIDYTDAYNVILNSVSIKNIESHKIDLNRNILGEFEYKHGSIIFNYSVPEYDKHLIVKYQYKLEGHFNKWTDWSEKSVATFENLSFGDYTFKVQAKIGNKLSSNISIYKFVVNKPWYFSNTALIVYFLFLSLMVLLIHRAYRKHYNKQYKLEQLANEEIIVRIKNEKLEQEIESKNRELAISTMSIIKKNEVLSSIKKELKSNESRHNYSIIKLIDSNLNDTKDWEFFEEAFNNADKHFLDKVKRVHPNLNPNDLRLCAYLRLNLSSKEIAPLLNISVRSLETKRYRLRKKMNLAHDDSLVNHILEI